MMPKKHESPRVMFCRRCTYILNGLRNNECPECGTPFSLQDGNTFVTERKHWCKQLFDQIIPKVLLISGFIQIGGVGFVIAVGMMPYPVSDALMFLVAGILSVSAGMLASNV